MKSLIAGLMLLVSTLALAEEPVGGDRIRDRMRAMGILMDEIWVRADQPATHVEAAGKVAELRLHMVHAIRHLPAKIVVMPELQRRQATIEFHQLMSRCIYLTASLEKALLDPDLQPTSESRSRDIRNLLREISVVAGKAHEQFR